MFMKVISLLLAAVALGSTDIENPIYDGDGKVVIADMSYEEMMDYSDDIWDRVESGQISPNDAGVEFADRTGYDVIDWQVANGEIIIALDEGTVDESTAEGMEGLDADMPLLFQKGFLQEY